MAELFKDTEKNIDVLDTLRKWIAKNGPAYGALKPEIKIYAKKPIRITIDRGDETVTLEKNTPL